LTAAQTYLEPLQPQLPAWMDRIKAYGQLNKVPIIDDDLGRLLQLICSLSQPRWILEIGCGIAYATHWMLMGCRQSRITALDRNRDRLAQCDRFLTESGFRDQVELQYGQAEDFLAKNRQPFDLLFLDAAKRDYGRLLDGCYRALKTGGLLVADNIFFGGKVFGLKPEETQKYSAGTAALDAFNRAIAVHGGFDAQFFPLSDGVLVARRTC
jgi:predicted O-methyltransferase YrrM